MNARSLGESNSGSVLSAEMRTLIAGVGGDAPTEQSLNWGRVRRLALTHRVAPLLHRGWNKAPKTTVPPALLHDFLRLRQQTAVHGALGIRQRDRILEVMAQVDLPILVLKGGALARTWYGETSLRPFVDLDMLVPASEIERARGLLLAHGYVDSREPGKVHHDVPLYRLDQPCFIELHHGLTSLPLAHPLSFEDVFPRAVRLAGPDSHVLALAPEDALLQLCAHFLLHMMLDRGWMLLHLCDVARHIDVFDLNWSVFASRAEEAGAGKGCAGVLGLAALVVGARVPPNQADETAALQLLPHPLPGVLQHRLQADFLAALMRLDFRKAGAAVLEGLTVPDKNENRRVRALRLHALLSPLWGLARGSVAERREVRTVVREWFPLARKWEQNEQLVLSLLVSRDSEAGVSGDRALRETESGRSIRPD